ncbi:MAG: hypothetical protein RL885_24970 [Planctomycetota bacterium]
MSEPLHTCSRQCERPECMNGQRAILVEMNERLAQELQQARARLEAAHESWRKARRWVADHYGELSTQAAMMDANDPRKAP